MTVGELMLLLQGCDKTHRVIVRGYEDGYDDVLAVRTQPIMVGVGGNWYNGFHQDPENGEEPDEIAQYIVSGMGDA